MSASLCIQVIGNSSAPIEEIKFFETEDWNANSEKELLVRIQELLSVVRDIGTSCEIKITLQVNDTRAAVFRIKKKNFFAFSDQ